MLFRILGISLLLMQSTLSFSQFNNAFIEERLVYGTDQDASIIISLPSINTTLYNGGFSYGDIYESDTKTLNLVTAADFDSDFNLITNARASYGGISVKKKKMVYSLHHEWTADVNINIPETLFDVIVDGNAQFSNNNFIINPSFQYLTVHRWSLGVAYSSETLHLGGQIHLYQGDEALYGKNTEINVIAQEDFFDLTFDKNIEVQSSGVINYRSLDDIDFIGNNSIFSANPFSKNFGLGLSVEASVQMTDHIRLYGRVDDIGFVKWSTQSVTYTDTSESSFSGIDIRDSYINEEPYSLKDSLYNLLTIEQNVGPFTGSLPISLVLGGNITFTDDLDFGITYRAKQTASAFRSLVQIKAGYQLSKGLRLSASNTMLKGSFINLGLGVRYRIAKTFSLYLDAINPWKFAKYYDSNLLHLNFGTYITL